VVVLAHGMLFGLRPVADASDRFDSERVGLDHNQLHRAREGGPGGGERRLEAAGDPARQTRDLPGFGIAILSFSDHDGVHLELTAPL
jgi:hypothetical protein